MFSRLFRETPGETARTVTQKDPAETEGLSLPGLFIFVTGTYSLNYSTVQYMKYLKPRGVLKKPLTLSSIMYRSV